MLRVIDVLEHYRLLIPTFMLWVFVVAAAGTLTRSAKERTPFENDGADEDKVYPRVIWTWFDRPEAPFVDLFVSHNMNVTNGTWKYIFLTADNVSLYLNTSTFPEHFEDLIPSHKSDYIRIRLVEEYGGLWMDFTTLIGSIPFLEEIRDRTIRENLAIYGYCTWFCPLKHFETGVFYAPAGSEVVKEWRKQVDLAYSMGHLNYIYETYRSGVTMSPEVFRYPNAGNYFIIFTAFQVVMERTLQRHTPYISISTRDGPYQLQEYCLWNRQCMVSEFKKQVEHQTYPIIKLNSGNRRHLWPKWKPNPGGRHQTGKPFISHQPLGVNFVISLLTNILHLHIIAGMSFCFAYIVSFECLEQQIKGTMFNAESVES